MLGCHGELCRRDFLIFTTFLFFSNFLLLPVRSSSIGVKAMRGDLRDSGNRSEHWGSKNGFIREDKNFLTSEEDSKLEQVKNVKLGQQTWSTIGGGKGRQKRIWVPFGRGTKINQNEKQGRKRNELLNLIIINLLSYTMIYEF